MTHQKLGLAIAAGILMIATPTASAQLGSDQQDAIRAEGLTNSHAVEYAAELADGIGARLSGSPNMQRAVQWSLGALSELRLENQRLEPADMSAIGWRQVNSWVRLAEPDAMVFEAQAGAWSVATKGKIAAEAVAVELDDDASFSRYRGQLAGKIVLLGPLRDTPPIDEALTRRYSNAEIIDGSVNNQLRESFQTRDARLVRQSEAGLFKARLRSFLEREGVAAVLVPSRESQHGGGSGNLSIDEGPFSVRSWTPSERPQFPFAYVSIENFGRVWRLARADKAPRLEMSIDIEESVNPVPSYNVIAEWPGSDPALRGQIVAVGAHLDSWASGTGALDNASGVAAVLEAIRILKATGYKPKRTIRVILFGAEEQGLFGSTAYVRRHLGSYPRSTTPDQMALASEGQRKAIGPLKKRPEYDNFSIIYNMDGGSGRIRGVFSGGNPELAALFRQWAAPLADLGMLAVYDEPFWPADQSSFSDIGLPGVMFQQDPLDYFTRARHSNLDTMERLSRSDMAQQATILATFLAHSASAKGLMPRSSFARTTQATEKR